MLTYKIQTSGNYPEESTQLSEQDESLKSRHRNKLIHPSGLIELSNFSWFKNTLGKTAPFVTKMSLAVMCRKNWPSDLILQQELTRKRRKNLESQVTKIRVCKSVHYHTFN
jgi:hypothetical protein